MSWERFRRILPRTARVNEAGRLELGGRDLTELVREHGTPLYVLDEADLRGRLRTYAEAFGPEHVHYGAKAFLTRSLVPVLVDEGVSLDCASGGELYTALAGGFPAERVVFHGNNKSVAELEMAVAEGVGRVAVDSPIEAERLERVAAEAGARVGVYLRVTPGIHAQTHDYLKTGIEDSKFGVPIGEPALRILRDLAASSHLDLRGLHSHIGSQVFDFEPFEEAAAVMTRFLAEARTATGAEIEELDLGGGIGIRYLPEDEPRAVGDLAKGVREAVASAADAAGIPAPTLKIEPGRSVVGPAMVTLYEVGTIKEVPEVRTYAAVDGGMSDNIRPMLYDAAYTFLSATRPEAPHDRPYTVCGKLCESGDVLRRDVPLPPLETGELLCVGATGAYGYAMASNYNKLPRPAVVAVRDGEVRVLARRETYEDLVRLEG